eukprot:1966083-Rhodomonas_salina.3
MCGSRSVTCGSSAGTGSDFLTLWRVLVQDVSSAETFPPPRLRAPKLCLAGLCDQDARCALSRF